MQKPKKTNLYYLIIIILGGLILRLIFFSGYVGGDDKHYITQAYKYSIGDFVPGDNLWALRIGLVIPTSFFFFLFGVNEFSSILFSLLCSIGNIILIYHLGKLLFDEKVGLIGAFLLSFYPLDVIYSTHLFPDIVLCFFTGLTIYLFLKGEDNEKKIWYLLSGISLGISYLIKESTVVICLFFIFYILYKRKIKINYFLVPLGFLLIVGLELTLYYFQIGDYFYRHHKIYERWPSSRDDINILRGSNWVIEPLLMLTTNQEFGLFYYFILPIIVYLLFKRDKKVNILLCWLIPCFLYLFYGSVSLFYYLPTERDERYTSIITLSALLILAYFLVRKMNKKFLVSSIILLFLTSIGAVYVDNSRIQDYVYRETYTFYKNHPNSNLIVDSFNYFSILFYTEFKTNPNLKVFYPDDVAKKSDVAKDIKKLYPDVEEIFDLNKVHNTYVSIDMNYINQIPLKAKLVKTIEKPQRFYYILLEKGFLKEVWEGIRGDRKYPFRKIYKIYYLD
ncbi:MAG: glycosyltransferase family 39 protein [bacterium]